MTLRLVFDASTVREAHAQLATATVTPNAWRADRCDRQAGANGLDRYHFVSMEPFEPTNPED